MGQRFFDVLSQLPVPEHLGEHLAQREDDDDPIWGDADSNYSEMYANVGEDGEELLTTVDAYVERLDELNIEKKVISEAEKVEHLIADYPDRFIPAATVYTRETPISAGVATLEDKIENRGYGSVRLAPYQEELTADDARYYPYYQTAEEHDVPVWIHSCTNFSKQFRSDYSHPRSLDAVCRDFPELSVIAGHGMWPWVAEGCALMWKHDNLYADFTAMRVKYIAEYTAWAPFMEYGTGVIKDSILFGTSHPLVDEAVQIQDVLDLDLDPAVQQRWCYDNAAAIYGV